VELGLESPALAGLSLFCKEFDGKSLILLKFKNCFIPLKNII
jgi:hypothetical protein